MDELVEELVDEDVLDEELVEDEVLDDVDDPPDELVVVEVMPPVDEDVEDPPDEVEEETLPLVLVTLPVEVDTAPLVELDEVEEMSQPPEPPPPPPQKPPPKKPPPPKPPPPMIAGATAPPPKAGASKGAAGAWARLTVPGMQVVVVVTVRFAWRTAT